MVATRSYGRMNEMQFCFKVPCQVQWNQAETLGTTCVGGYGNMGPKMRTRSGQGSYAENPDPNARPPIPPRPPQAVDDGNSRGEANPRPLTLEAIQKLLHDSQVQTRQEMTRLLDERLGERSKSQNEDSEKSVAPEGTNPTQNSSQGDSSSKLQPQFKTKGVCTFKDFMSCRPKEFNGEMDSRITIR
ncbi:hypothetical protein L2E82_35554 [Cichorium intybus]|uniref:Uncharacterized protein n=1 Tax=Cichorium intybus TaxID=13427 RepID=A0ACB9BP30_CICIN|nr:hypothetical protein L2E82_35554 [Cichorium intybus]